MNVAYKHLDAKLRISELTIGQWLGLFVATMGAILYATYFSPFGTALTLATAVYVGGLPVAVIIVASFSEFDLWQLVRSAARWRRLDARYLPGPGTASAGYRLTEALEDSRRAERDRIAQLDLASLWGEVER